MLNLLLIRHSQARLRMLLHNISPLGNQTQPCICFLRFLTKYRRAICSAEWAMGFHNPMQARLRRDLKTQRQLGLPKHSPAFIRPLFYPCPSVVPKNDFAQTPPALARLKRPESPKPVFRENSCNSWLPFPNNFTHSSFRISYHPPDALLQPDLRFPPQILPRLSVRQHHPWQ
jgi:hypothetical protein